MLWAWTVYFTVDLDRYENIFIYIKVQLFTFCGFSQLIILLIIALRASYILYNHFVNLLRSKFHSNPKSKSQYQEK